MAASRSLTLAVAALVAAVSATTLGAAWSHIGRPFPGFLPAANGIVSQLELPDWPGAQAGLRFNDWIEEVEGVPTNSGDTVWAHARAIAPGTTVKYVANRPGLLGGHTQSQLTIPTRLFGLADFFTVFLPLWATGVFVACSGFLLYIVRPEPRTSQVFLATSLSLSLLLLTGFDYYSSHIFYRLTPLASAIFLGTLLHLAVLLLRPRTTLFEHRWLSALTYSPSVLIGVGLQLTMFTHLSAFVVFTDIAFIFSTASVTTFTVASFRTSRASRSSSVRRQARIQAVGIGILMSIPLLIATLTAIGGASFPLGMVVPLAAGLALVAPYSLASLLEEDSVIRFFFSERYQRVQSLRLLSQALVGASSLSEIANAVTTNLRASIGRVSEVIVAGERLGQTERSRIKHEDIMSESYINAALGGTGTIGTLAYARYFPIHSDAALFGALAVEATATSSALTEEEVELLGGFCSQAAVAMERTLATAALEDLNKNLGRIVQTRTAALESQNRTLQELNREIQLYARALSHDLRGPIVSVASALRLACHAAPSQVPDLERYLGLGKVAVERALEMLDAMLEMRRAVREAEPEAEVALEDLVRELQTEFQLDLTSRGIDLQIDCRLAKVYGQREKLKHVFRNLIGNAIKYVVRASEPQIQVGCSIASSDGETIVHVRDNGVGMPSHYLEHVFDLFQRVPSEETVPSPGIGMGLAIAKEIMEQQGGRIWVESRSGEGAAFFLAFPRTRRNLDSTPSHMFGRTILLVEDDDVLSTAIESTLSAEGAKVVIAASGELGLQLLASHFHERRPDAIVLDIGLPGISGTEVLVQVRAAGSPHASVPVIVCSDPRNVRDSERCTMLGIHQFVPKDARFLETLTDSLKRLEWTS